MWGGVAYVAFHGSFHWAGCYSFTTRGPEVDQKLLGSVGNLWNLVGEGILWPRTKFCHHLNFNIYQKLRRPAQEIFKSSSAPHFINMICKIGWFLNLKKWIFWSVYKNDKIGAWSSSFFPVPQVFSYLKQLDFDVTWLMHVPRHGLHILFTEKLPLASTSLGRRGWPLWMNVTMLMMKWWTLGHSVK